MRAALRHRVERLEAQQRVAANRAYSAFVVRIREKHSSTAECSMTQERCPHTGQVRTMIYLNPGEENL
jgi:hypothetical protein